MNLYYRIVNTIYFSGTPWGTLGGSTDLGAIGSVDTGSLALALRRGGIALCFLMIGISVVKLLIYHDQKNRAEIKQDITHKMVVIILIASMITLFGLMKNLFDNAFGF